MPPQRMLTSFFKRLTTPNHIDDEIVVATPSTGSGAGDGRSKKQTSGASRPSQHVKISLQKGARPPKSHGLSSSPSSSASNNAASASGGASPTDDMAAPAAPPAIAEPAPKPTQTDPVASFSPASTLTSVPPSSRQTATSGTISATSSSKRIIKDGLQAVPASDSECESSDDDLLDPIAFLRPKAAMSAADLPRTEPSRSDTNRGSKLDPFMASRRSAEQGLKRKLSHASTSFVARKVPRKSLAQIAADAHARDLLDAKIISMEHAVGEAKRQEEASKQLEELGIGQDGGDCVVGDGRNDDDDIVEGERGRLAMQRTEASQRKDQYYFFLDDRPLFDDTPFPVDALPDAPWSKLYAHNESRKQACKSGFAAQVAARHPLPVTVTNWLAHQLNYEQDEGMCEAYVNILKACSLHEGSLSNSIASISSMYRTRSSFEHNWTEQLRRGLPAGLKNVLRVVAFCAPAADGVVSDAYPSMTAAAFLDLAMINIDELVQKDVNMALSVASCIEQMLDLLPADEKSLENLISEVIGILFLPGDLSPIIRCRVIASLPSSTPRAYRIRRRLALECFSTANGRKGSKEQDWPMSIHKSLRTRSELSITPDTNYDLLEAYIDVLEVAVAVGFTPYPELTTSRIPTGGLLATMRPVPTAAGKLHDEHVDGLIRRLKYVTSRIRGGGTTHMRMTEVKTRIEKFLTRLANSVRTHPPPKRGIFDGDEMEQSTLTFGSSRGHAKELSIRSPKPVKSERVKTEATKEESVKVEPMVDTKFPSILDDAATDGGTTSWEGTPKFLPLPGEQLSFTEDDIPPAAIEQTCRLSTPGLKEEEKMPPSIALKKDVDSDDDREFVTCVEIESQ